MDKADVFIEYISLDGDLIKEAIKIIDSKVKQDIDHLNSLLEWSARSGYFTSTQGKNIYLKIDTIREKTNFLINVIVDSLIDGYMEVVKEYINMTIEKYKEYSDRVISILDELIDLAKVKEEKSRLQKILSQREAEEFARKNGYEKIRQTGDHMIYKNDDGKVAVIPAHGKQFAKEMGYILQHNIKNNQINGGL